MKPIFASSTFNLIKSLADHFIVFLRDTLGLPGAFFLPILAMIHLSLIWSSRLVCAIKVTLIS